MRLEETAGQNDLCYQGNCHFESLVVKEGEEPGENAGKAAYGKLEATLLEKVEDIQKKIQHTENLEELHKLSTTLSELLVNLEKIKKMKKR